MLSSVDSAAEFHRPSSTWSKVTHERQHLEHCWFSPGHMILLQESENITLHQYRNVSQLNTKLTLSCYFKLSQNVGRFSRRRVLNFITCCNEWLAW